MLHRRSGPGSSRRCGPIPSSPCSSPWRSGSGSVRGNWPGFALGSVTATLLAAILIGQLGITVDGPIKSDVLPAVPLRGRLRRRTAVLPRHRQGRPKQIVFSLIVLAFCLLVPVACALDRRAGRRIRGGPVCRVPDDLGGDRRRVRPDRPPRPDRRGGKGPSGRHPHRLRRHLHLRHDWLRRPAGAARPEADRRRSAGRLRRVRAADGRRRWDLEPGVFSAYRAIEVRAYAIDAGSPVTGRPVRELFPDLRIFVERVRRGDR